MFLYLSIFLAVCSTILFKINSKCKQILFFTFQITLNRSEHNLYFLRLLLDYFVKHEWSWNIYFPHKIWTIVQTSVPLCMECFRLTFILFAAYLEYPRVQFRSNKFWISFICINLCFKLLKLFFKDANLIHIFKYISVIAIFRLIVIKICNRQITILSLKSGHKTSSNIQFFT